MHIEELVAQRDGRRRGLTARLIELNVKDPDATRAVILTDPDGYRVAIQTPTDASPPWLRAMVP